MRESQGSFNSPTYDEPIRFQVVTPDGADRREVPVILSPGFAEPLRASKIAARFLARETGRQVAVFDEHPFTVCAEGIPGKDVASVISIEVQEHLDFAVAHRVGHSTGGAGDVKAASERPELFRSILGWSLLGLVRTDVIPEETKKAEAEEAAASFPDESGALKRRYARNIAEHIPAGLIGPHVFKAGMYIARTLLRNRGHAGDLFYEAANHDLRRELEAVYKTHGHNMRIYHARKDILFPYPKVLENIEPGRHCGSITPLPGGHEAIASRAGLRQLAIVARPLVKRTTCRHSGSISPL